MNEKAHIHVFPIFTVSLASVLLPCQHLHPLSSCLRQGLVPRVWQAEEHHLSCPPPKLFDFAVGGSNSSSLRHIWRASYEQSVREARALRRLTLRNRNFTATQFWREVFSDWPPVYIKCDHLMLQRAINVFNKWNSSWERVSLLLLQLDVLLVVIWRAARH